MYSGVRRGCLYAEFYGRSRQRGRERESTAVAGVLNDCELFDGCRPGRPLSQTRNTCVRFEGARRTVDCFVDFTRQKRIEQRRRGRLKRDEPSLLCTSCCTDCGSPAKRN